MFCSVTCTWNRVQQLKAFAVESGYPRGACGVLMGECEQGKCV